MATPRRRRCCGDGPGAGSSRTSLRGFINGQRRLALGEIHPSMSEWYLKANSRRAARSTLVSADDLEALTDLVARGVSKRDDLERTVMEQLGYRLALWNGQDTNPIALELAAGMTTNRVPNSVLINLGDVDGDTFSRDTLSAVMAACVQVWELDEVVPTDREMRARQSEIDGPELGYITYRRGVRHADMAVGALTVRSIDSGVLVDIEGDDVDLLAETDLVAATKPRFATLRSG